MLLMDPLGMDEKGSMLKSLSSTLRTTPLRSQEEHRREAKSGGEMHRQQKDHSSKPRANYPCKPSVDESTQRRVSGKLIDEGTSDLPAVSRTVTPICRQMTGQMTAESSTAGGQDLSSFFSCGNYVLGEVANSNHHLQLRENNGNFNDNPFGIKSLNEQHLRSTGQGKSAPALCRKTRGESQSKVQHIIQDAMRSIEDETEEAENLISFFPSSSSRTKEAALEKPQQERTGLTAFEQNEDFALVPTSGMNFPTSSIRCRDHRGSANDPGTRGSGQEESGSSRSRPGFLLKKTVSTTESKMKQH